MKHILSTVALVTLSGTASAQAFNVDIGSVAFGFGIPANTYGAASGSVGEWNAVDIDLLTGLTNYASPPLVTTANAPSPVTVEFNTTVAGGYVFLEFDNANTFGDDEALFDDAGYVGGPHSITVHALAPGDYDVYMYSMAPDNSSFLTDIAVTGSPDPLQAVGGDFIAGFVLGVTHSRHRVTVALGGTIEILLSINNLFDTMNGLQIVPATPSTLGTPYCPANVNTTGSPAAITATGSAVAANNNVTLTCSGMPANQFGFFVTSTTQIMLPNPGGSAGILCVGGTIGRYVGAGQILNSGAQGTFALVLNLPQTPSGGAFVAVTAGQTRNFQGWFRDTGPMGAPSSNFSNAVSILFQ